MRFWEYIKDKAGILIGYLLFIAIMLIAFRAMRTPWELTVIFLVLTVLLLVIAILTDYIKRRHFYNSLYAHMEGLDQKYLVVDTLEEPGFYEGKLVYEALYEINKSMTEHVKEYRQSVDDFKDFIEIWVHEIKLPIASLVLMCHNNQDKIPKKYEDQVNRLDAYADQVLYYVRAEHASKDYRFDSVRIKSVVNKVALKNKDMLLESDICLDVHDVDVNVTTDAKWLEFMINQIVSNSIKYMKPRMEAELQGPHREADISNEYKMKSDNTDTSVDEENGAMNEDRQIQIWTTKEDDNVTLHIRDNGIGISEADLPRVCEKSFTGENGRRFAKSTGMGLYIVKGLCDQLGHRLTITSRENIGTEVAVTFGGNDYYLVDA